MPTTAYPRALPAAGLERAFQHTLTTGLAALGLFLPFSTAGTSIAMAALLLLCLLAAPRVVRLAPWREPVLAVGLALLGWILLRTFANGIDTRALASVNRYHELLLVPLLWALLRISHAPQALFLGLAAGALMLAGLHWIAPAVDALGPWLGARRISAGFGMAISAFLLFEHGRQGLLPRRAAFLAAAFLALTVLFATDGRTGHVVLLLLLGCAAWRASSGRWRWAAALLLVLVGVLLSSLSHPMRSRITETLAVAHANSHESQALTSTNIRVQLLRSGMQVARENPLVGTGWADYRDAFARAGTQLGMAAGPWSRGDNPHNEYLMQLGAGGLPALALFLAWLAMPLVQAARPTPQPDAWRGAIACVTLAFAVGCLFNSMLLDFVEGHLYATVLAWMLARSRPGGG